LKTDLKQHMMKAHDKESMKRQCKICNVWLYNIDKLKIHTRSHTGEKPLKCDFCEDTFANHSNRSQHRSLYHADSWKAEKERRQWILDNKHRDPSEFKVKCHLCEETRSTTEELQLHWNDVHPGKTDKPQRTFNGQRIRRDGVGFRKGFGDSMCPVCGEMYKAVGLSFHIRHAHPESYRTPLSCEICGEGLRSKISLERHMLAKHTPGGKEKVKTLNNVQTSICQMCGKSVQNLNSHMKTHDESVKPKECTYCGKQFSAFKFMACHRRVAHRDQWNRDKESLMVKEGSECLPGSYKEAYKKKWAVKQKEKERAMKKI